MTEFVVTYLAQFAKPINASTLEDAGRLAKLQESTDPNMKLLSVKTLDRYQDDKRTGTL